MNFRKILVVVIIISGIVMVTCKKDGETEMLRKESLTIKLNSEINADSLQAYVTWLQISGTRFALADNHRDIALKIKKKFIRLGYSTCNLDSFIIVKTFKNISYRQLQYNVTATIPGTLNPDSICVIGAHYDNILSSGDPFSVGSGANDNASGVAATLEIARVMKKNHFSPANTIIFATFGSEELGLLGSYAYSDSLYQNSGKVKLMLNNDMIAYQPSPLKADWIVNISDYDNSHSLRSDAEQLCTKYTSLRYSNVNTYNKQTDSYPFFVNGYKAIYFASGIIDPNYHTLNDKAANCNFEYSREIVRLCCAILIDKN